MMVWSHVRSGLQRDQEPLYLIIVARVKKQMGSATWTCFGFLCKPVNCWLVDSPKAGFGNRLSLHWLNCR
jgi:hypothetical protein